MKTLSFVLLMLVASFSFAQQSKKIIAKESPIENRFSASDFFFGNGSITKSETVYYLIAEDGTACEVKVGIWAKTKIGDSHSCKTLWVDIE
jgi:hypothetical protein